MAKKEKAKEEATQKVTVKAVPERGFRRCGRHFTQSPVEVAVTPSEFEALKAEPNLVVTEKK